MSRTIDSSLLLLLLFLCGPVLAQSTVSGTLQDETQKPVPYATIVLLNSDSVVIRNTQSGPDGSFSLTQIRGGTYRLAIQNLQYELLIIAIEIDGIQSLPLGNIALSTRTEELDEVIIEAEKPLYEVKPGMTIFNIASDPSNMGNDGLTLLGKAPGIIIDPDNNIVFQGRTGVRVFINGRPSRLSGDDLAAMLMGLQADDIESVELITNPPAKYEAEGGNGIINIIIRESTDAGLNGSVYGNFTKGTYLRYNSGLSFNYRKGKVNLYSNLNYTNNETQDDYFDYKLQNGYRIDMENPAKNKLESIGFMAGLDYNISEQHTLAVLVTGNNSQRDVNGESTSNIALIADNELIEILYAQTIQDFKSRNWQYNLNYSFDPNENFNLSTDLNFGTFTNRGNSFQPNTYYEPDGITVIRDNDFLDKRDTDINIFAGKIDAEKSMGQLSLSGGVKVSLIETINDFTLFDLENDPPTPDPDNSNTFTYTEDVLAAYAQVSSELGLRWRYDLGIRYEYTFSEGILKSQQDVENNRVKRSYGNIFPTIGLTYEDKDRELMLSVSYGKRVARPNYQNLNPFEYRLSELSILRGNPFLLPSFTNQYQVAYSVKNRLTGTIGYSKQTDYAAEILQIVDETVTILQPENMQDIDGFFTTISYPIEILPLWDIRMTGSYNYSKFSGEFETTSVDLEAHVYTFMVLNNIKLTDNFRANINFMYNSPWVWRGSIDIAEFYNLSFGLTHDFFNKTLQLRITGTDILNTASDFNYIGDYGDLYVDGIWSGDMSRFGAGLTWKFGNQQLKERKARRTAIEEEMNRVE